MRFLPPVRVAAPQTEPVSLEEAKQHLRVDHDLDDDVIRIGIKAATRHLDGYGGILGRALIAQSWRQDFGFWPAGGCVRLPLAPVASIEAVTYRPASGDPVTVPADGYELIGEQSDPAIIFPVNFAPALRNVPAAVSVTFVAGYGEAGEDVPADLRFAILLMVGHFMRFPDGANAQGGAVPVSPVVDRLVSSYRRLRV